MKKMQRYKKILGFLFPHKKGEFVKVDDVADVLFPLAYTMEPTIETKKLREVLAAEVWGTFTRTFLEVQKRIDKEDFSFAVGGEIKDRPSSDYPMSYRHKRIYGDDFHEFLDAALKEKVRLHGDRPFLC